MGDPAPIEPYTHVRYSDPDAIVKSWDPRAPVAVARVIALLAAALPETPAEHIGSTALPGCDGKGVIDLIIPYPPVGSRPFPPGRSVWAGSISHDARRYRLHVHSLSAGDPEV